MIDNEPIKSQAEADIIRQYLVDTTAEVLKIDIEEAGKRVDALLKSRILDGGNPDETETQMRIDIFLSMPSEEHEYLFKKKKMMKKKKAYIGGKISGLDLAEAKAKFQRMEQKLRDMGYEPLHGFDINDVDVDNHTKSWEECVKADLKVMLDCDEVHLLPCWNESKGAMLERDIAIRVGIPVVYH